MAEEIGCTEYRLARNGKGEYCVELRTPYTGWSEHEYLGAHSKSDAIDLYKKIITNLKKEYFENTYMEVDIDA